MPIFRKMFNPFKNIYNIFKKTKNLSAVGVDIDTNDTNIKNQEKIKIILNINNIYVLLKEICAQFK